MASSEITFREVGVELRALETLIEDRLNELLRKVPGLHLDGIDVMPVTSIGGVVQFHVQLMAKICPFCTAEDEEVREGEGASGASRH